MLNKARNHRPLCGVIIRFIVVFLVPPIQAVTPKNATGWYKFIRFLLSGALSRVGYLAYKILVISKLRGREHNRSEADQGTCQICLPALLRFVRNQSNSSLAFTHFAGDHRYE